MCLDCSAGNFKVSEEARFPVMVQLRDYSTVTSLSANRRGRGQLTERAESSRQTSETSDDGLTRIY
jgi:hypothetical protein